MTQLSLGTVLDHEEATIGHGLSLRRKMGFSWPGDWATAYAHQWDGTIWGCNGTYRQQEEGAI